MFVRKDLLILVTPGSALWAAHNAYGLADPKSDEYLGFYSDADAAVLSHVKNLLEGIETFLRKKRTPGTTENELLSCDSEAFFKVTLAYIVDTSAPTVMTLAGWPGWCTWFATPYSPLDACRIYR